MNGEDYVSIPVTPDMLEDPDEPGIPPLEAMMRRLEAELLKGGTPVYRTELRPGAKPGYKVTCVPKDGASRLNIELNVIEEEACPACGTILDYKGRCRACWGDVMGICANCGDISEDEHHCDEALDYK